MTDLEKACATNCVRKHEKAYQLYGKLEPQIFSAHMETTEIDPEQFYAELNQMSKEDQAVMKLTQATGLQPMKDVAKAYSTKG